MHRILLAVLLVGCGSLHPLAEHYDDTGVPPLDTAPPVQESEPPADTAPPTDTGPDTHSDPTMLCTDTCFYAFDGDCDDGGPGADFDLCDYGTDCADCGPRPPQEDGGSTVLCTDDCIWADDGWCDDGGPGADFDLCDLGTDCTDCGPRHVDDSGDGSGSGGELCTNTCPWAYDGDCDDGGPGADYDLCDLGTDCADCGPR